MKCFNKIHGNQYISDDKILVHFANNISYDNKSFRIVSGINKEADRFNMYQSYGINKNRCFIDINHLYCED